MELPCTKFAGEEKSVEARRSLQRSLDEVLTHVAAEDLVQRIP